MSKRTTKRRKPQGARRSSRGGAAKRPGGALRTPPVPDPPDCAGKTGQPAASDAPTTVADISADLDRGLTPKQIIFVREYLRDHNGKRAAIEAGYSPRTAASQASRMLTHVNVQRALADALAPKVEKIELSVERVLDELMAIGFSNLADVISEDEKLLPIHKWPLRAQRAIGSLEVAREVITQRDQGTNDVSVIVQDQIIKVKSWDKPRALEMLARNLKMLTDKLEVEGRLDVTSAMQQHRAAMKRVPMEDLEPLAASADAYIRLFEAARTRAALPTGKAA